MERIKKIFNFIASIKASIILLNIIIIIFISQIVIKSDLFYIILQTYVENNFKESKYLTKYIENLRMENFYGKSEFDEKMQNINSISTDKYWSYTPIKNRDVYSEFKEKITNKNDLRNAINLFKDLDNFYFDLINGKYTYDKENAFYKLKEILEKHKCKVHTLETKYKINWHKTIVSSVNGLVYETLYYTQTVNDKMLDGRNRLEVIMRYGDYFLQILMPDKCVDIK